MRIDDLALFRRMAALGGIAAAGREAGLSPASASARLAALEQHLGARLFTRSTRRIALTEEGRLFLDHAETALDALETGRTALQERTLAPSGVLRVSANGSFGRKHILPHLRAFGARYPGVRLSLRFTDTSEDLVAGDIDVAIRIGPLRDSSLVAVRLSGNHRIMVASPAYIAERGMPRAPAELAGHDCIIAEQLRVWHLEGPGGSVDLRPEPSLLADGGEATRDAALYGLGIAIKSIWDIAEELEAGTLVPVMPGWSLGGSGSVWAVRASRRLTPPKSAAFIGFLKETFARNSHWETGLPPSG